MNIIEKLEKYFNTGSTEQQNKRRLGGLLVAITAILLVISILALSVGGAVALVSGLIGNIKGDGDGSGSSVNNDLVSVTDKQIADDAALNTIPLMGNDVTLSAGQYTVLTKDNRAKTADGSVIYGCYNAYNFALQTEVAKAFNAMMTDFYTDKSSFVYLRNAYMTDGSTAGSAYGNALTVQLEVWDGNATLGNGTIFGYIDEANGKVKPYEWIYENAYRYGFVRTSAAEGEENIFRFVGLAHAKYIYEQQKKAIKGGEFYTISDYVEEIKLSTPDKEETFKNVKEIGGPAKTLMSYSVYYMAAVTDAAPAPDGTTPDGTVGYRLPDPAKFTYSVMALEEGGYIVSEELGYQIHVIVGVISHFHFK